MKIHTPYQRYLKWRDIERMQGGESEASIENIQEAMRDALIDHLAWCHGDIGAKGGPTIDPLPQEMAFALQIWFRNIIYGFSNPYTTPIKSTKGGGKGWHPDQYEAIADAVCYLKYADAGIVKDKTPFKTIQQYYGVSRDTVKNWKNDEQFDYIRIFEDRTHEELKKRIEFGGNFYKQEYSLSAKREKKKKIK